MAPKTTMRIGGTARYFAELRTREDVENTWRFAREHHLPLIPLGAGSNTIFADGTVEAVVIQVKADSVKREANSVTVQAGKHLALLVSECAKSGLDLSALAGIPGTVGGAVFGNAGQGPEGVWTGSFLSQVEVFVDGAWKVFSREECGFGYRDSVFKSMRGAVIWEAVFSLPVKTPGEIEAEIQKLLQHRKDAQFFGRTAGSCFKGLPDGASAWKLIDAANLRGFQVGGVQISEKHANFLVNSEGKGTFADAVAIVEKVKRSVPALSGVEMRFIESDGSVRY
ncbi:MAG: UDP-N-acetylmuramate dehydrogenase [Candidatus Peribacteraceae bacterium]